MGRWVSCSDGFVPADVVRWEETAWENRGRSRKPRNAGRRKITAEVLKEDGADWVLLLVRASAVLSEKPGYVVAPPPKNTEIRRKRSTIERGKPERLLWSDETARALLSSRFLSVR